MSCSRVALSSGRRAAAVYFASQALIDDHMNDVWINLIGGIPAVLGALVLPSHFPCLSLSGYPWTLPPCLRCFPDLALPVVRVVRCAAGFLQKGWWLDAAGGIALSVYIGLRWAKTCRGILVVTFWFVCSCFKGSFVVVVCLDDCHLLSSCPFCELFSHALLYRHHNVRRALRHDGRAHRRPGQDPRTDGHGLPPPPGRAMRRHRVSTRQRARKHTNLCLLLRLFALASSACPVLDISV